MNEPVECSSAVTSRDVNVVDQSSSAVTSTYGNVVEHSSSIVTPADVSVSILKTPSQHVVPRILHNSKGEKEYIPGCSLQKKPVLGMKFDSLQDGIDFYSNKEWFVSTNKSRVEKNVDSAVLKKKLVKRVGCGARIKFRYCSGGKYMIHHFYESHCHPFATPITRQVNKCEVGITYVHKKIIFDNAKLNIGALMSYRFMKEMCGGYKHVKCSKNDFKNFYRDLKVYILDADGAMHLTRAFWADLIRRKDYIFSCLVTISFDTTNDTDKYSLVFFPFTGVDHHKRSIIFCAAFLSKEDIESFVWLFQTLLRCMGKKPSCIITDQDPAMGIAIEKLCQGTDFLKKLSAVFWDREIEPYEFVQGWNLVLQEFGLQNHEWFVHMFNIKHLWIPAYFRELFMGGLRSTSRSEGENNFFCNFINPHVTCVKFILRYETALDAHRREQDELTRLNKSMPQLVTQLQLEKHASLVYTRAIFYEFQQECEAACYSCGVESCNFLYGDGVEFSIIVDNGRRKNFDVTFDLSTHECTCTCKMYES
ncbi:protein FAR1-RELATED SEQUENCE 5-like [Chenopodium quinoa]|uniref:protein FAR1-RELATED SEQUENCE 5-like n=1 Tax=Chenopodium quinoa TaxID=63459 RepID=UPI000B791A85|nr:protein FAR1-RELATED SEQUENCE 5-like [Chenopodium quinoa]